MAIDLGRKAFRAATALAFVAAAGLVAGCTAQTPKPRSMVAKTKSKEYFAESEYGVKASPRVSMQRSNLPRGGGRDQIGKPYQIKGKWYYPKEQADYARKGKASWYGDAFHGRLTANGEVYDMTHLSAAHPTMPLPSYARVTNLKNGSSVMVRVNDRGPYAQGRIIDLSKRAAEMLDYTHSGIADVKVEYVARAPLEGRDDEYLLASYKAGGGAADPSDGLPTGVMIAMAGPTPAGGADGQPAAAAFPGTLTNSGQATVTASAFGVQKSLGMSEFPENGPVIIDRPVANTAGLRGANPLSYAPASEGRAASALDRLAGSAATGAASDAYISVGTFDNAAEVRRQVAALSGIGKVEVETVIHDGVTWRSVNLRPGGKISLDAALEAAWANGAADAFVVRD
ncbi:MAG: septal ring lytic transglycosylase RlpA family protein [Mesorhizobium sp.]